MLKFFEFKHLPMLLIALYLTLLFMVRFYSNRFSVELTDTFIVESLIGLLIGLITITLPLFASREAESKRKYEEDKRSALTVAQYVGNEILDNVIKINTILDINKKTLAEMPSPPDEWSEKHRDGGMWAAVAEEVNTRISDKWHQNIVTSGLIAKLPDEKQEIVSSIRSTYQKQDSMLERLNTIGKFYHMLETPPPNATVAFMKKMIDEKLMVGIKEAQIDMDLYIKDAKKTTKLINNLIKPYGMQIEIKDVTPEDI